MQDYLATEATRKLNFFPPKGGISLYYCPREIMPHERLNYTKQCMIPQFSYVLAPTERGIKSDQHSPGIPRSHKLRVIHLYEADLNALIGIKCWRQLIHHVMDTR
jgi:hypothetical protein